MATHYQSGSWSSPSILAGYGLSATIGPTEPTPADVKRLNSRSGGEHPGHGNWMQTFNPRPIVKSGTPKKMYDYDIGEEVVVRSRLPGLESRKVVAFKGFKKQKEQKDLKKNTPAVDVLGAQVNPVVGGGNRPANPDLINEIRAARREMDMGAGRRRERYRPPAFMIGRQRGFLPQPRPNNLVGPNAAQHIPPPVAPHEAALLAAIDRQPLLTDAEMRGNEEARGIPPNNPRRRAPMIPPMTEEEMRRVNVPRAA